MKARIEKKISKKLVKIAPSLFKNAWIYRGEPSDLAYEQGSCVSDIWHMGGGLDYWGEGQDAYTAWQWWLDSFMWHGPFASYPDGHEFEGYPDLTGFKQTTRNLLNLAALVDSESAGK
ncbi:MAG: hypothetical protein ACRCXB_09995 [Aeromonadaceae bacterium]